MTTSVIRTAIFGSAGVSGPHFLKEVAPGVRVYAQRGGRGQWRRLRINDEILAGDKLKCRLMPETA